MNFNFFYKRTPLVLAHSAAQLYLMQLNQTHEGYSPHFLATEPLAEALSAEGKVKDFAPLGLALQKLASKEHLQGRSVAFAVPYAMTRMNTLHLPKGLPHDDIEAEIKSQIQRDMLMGSQSFYIDYTALATTETAYTPYLYVAAHADDVDAYMHCIAAAGLHPKIVDIDLLAYVRAVQVALNRKIDQTLLAILQVSLPLCHLIVVHHNNIVLYETWQASDLETLWLSVNKKINMALPALMTGNIQHWIICGANKMDEEGLKKITIATKHTFTFLTVAALLHLEPHQETQFAELPLFTACVLMGLALRRMPAW